MGQSINITDVNNGSIYIRLIEGGDQTASSNIFNGLIASYNGNDLETYTLNDNSTNFKFELYKGIWKSHSSQGDTFKWGDKIASDEVVDGQSSYIKKNKNGYFLLTSSPGIYRAYIRYYQKNGSGEVINSQTFTRYFIINPKIEVTPIIDGTQTKFQLSWNKKNISINEDNGSIISCENTDTTKGLYSIFKDDEEITNWTDSSSTDIVSTKITCDKNKSYNISVVTNINYLEDEEVNYSDAFRSNVVTSSCKVVENLSLSGVKDSGDNILSGKMAVSWNKTIDNDKFQLKVYKYLKDSSSYEETPSVSFEVQSESESTVKKEIDVSNNTLYKIIVSSDSGVQSDTVYGIVSAIELTKSKYYMSDYHVDMLWDKIKKIDSDDAIGTPAVTRSVYDSETDSYEDETTLSSGVKVASCSDFPFTGTNLPNGERVGSFKYVLKYNGSDLSSQYFNGTTLYNSIKDDLTVIVSPTISLITARDCVIPSTGTPYYYRGQNSDEFLHCTNWSLTRGGDPVTSVSMDADHIFVFVDDAELYELKGAENNKSEVGCLRLIVANPDATVILHSSSKQLEILSLQNYGKLVLSLGTKTESFYRPITNSNDYLRGVHLGLYDETDGQLGLNGRFEMGENAKLYVLTSDFDKNNLDNEKTLTLTDNIDKININLDKTAKIYANVNRQSYPYSCWVKNFSWDTYVNGSSKKNSLEMIHDFTVLNLLTPYNPVIDGNYRRIWVEGDIKPSVASQFYWNVDSSSCSGNMDGNLKSGTLVWTNDEDYITIFSNALNTIVPVVLSTTISDFDYTFSSSTDDDESNSEKISKYVESQFKDSVTESFVSYVNDLFTYWIENNCYWTTDYESDTHTDVQSICNKIIELLPDIKTTSSGVVDYSKTDFFKKIISRVGEVLNSVSTSNSSTKSSISSKTGIVLFGDINQNISFVKDVKFNFPIHVKKRNGSLYFIDFTGDVCGWNGLDRMFQLRTISSNESIPTVYIDEDSSITIYRDTYFYAADIKGNVYINTDLSLTVYYSKRYETSYLDGKAITERKTGGYIYVNEVIDGDSAKSSSTLSFSKIDEPLHFDYVKNESNGSFISNTGTWVCRSKDKDGQVITYSVPESLRYNNVFHLPSNASQEALNDLIALNSAYPDEGTPYPGIITIVNEGNYKINLYSGDEDRYASYNKYYSFNFLINMNGSLDFTGTENSSSDMTVYVNDIEIFGGTMSFKNLSFSQLSRDNNNIHFNQYDGSSGKGYELCVPEPIDFNATTYDGKDNKKYVKFTSSYQHGIVEIYKGGLIISTGNDIYLMPDIESNFNESLKGEGNYLYILADDIEITGDKGSNIFLAAYGKNIKCKDVTLKEVLTYATADNFYFSGTAENMTVESNSEIHGTVDYLKAITCEENNISECPCIGNIGHGNQCKSFTIETHTTSKRIQINTSVTAYIHPTSDTLHKWYEIIDGQMSSRLSSENLDINGTVYLFCYCENISVGTSGVLNALSCLQKYYYCSSSYNVNLNLDLGFISCKNLSVYSKILSSNGNNIKSCGVVNVFGDIICRDSIYLEGKINLIEKCVTNKKYDDKTTDEWNKYLSDWSNNLEDGSFICERSDDGYMILKSVNLSSISSYGTSCRTVDSEVTSIDSLCLASNERHSYCVLFPDGETDSSGSMTNRAFVQDIWIEQPFKVQFNTEKLYCQSNVSSSFSVKRYKRVYNQSVATDDFVVDEDFDIVSFYGNSYIDDQGIEEGKTLKNDYKYLVTVTPNNGDICWDEDWYTGYPVNGSNENARGYGAIFATWEDVIEEEQDDEEETDKDNDSDEEDDSTAGSISDFKAVMTDPTHMRLDWYLSSDDDEIITSKIHSLTYIAKDCKPLMPSDLTFSMENNHIKLSWTVNSSISNGSVVYRKEKETDQWTLLSKTSDSVYEDSDAQKNKLYYYKVCSCNDEYMSDSIVGQATLTDTAVIGISLSTGNPYYGEEMNVILSPIPSTVVNYYWKTRTEDSYEKSISTSSNVSSVAIKKEYKNKYIGIKVTISDTCFNLFTESVVTKKSQSNQSDEQDPINIELTNPTVYIRQDNDGNYYFSSEVEVTSFLPNKVYLVTLSTSSTESSQPDEVWWLDSSMWKSNVWCDESISPYESVTCAAHIYRYANVVEIGTIIKKKLEDLTTYQTSSLIGILANMDLTEDSFYETISSNFNDETVSIGDSEMAADEYIMAIIDKSDFIKYIDPTVDVDNIKYSVLKAVGGYNKNPQPLSGFSNLSIDPTLCLLEEPFSDVLNSGHDSIGYNFKYTPMTQIINGVTVFPFSTTGNYVVRFIITLRDKNVNPIVLTYNISVA